MKDYLLTGSVVASVVLLLAIVVLLGTMGR